jgi:5-(carboxyamino)imidazole ribonucleotide synthase
MSGPTVGIIGDGQLGMMLCEAAVPLGLPTVMLTADAASPAAARASAAIEGAMGDEAALHALVDRCDVITYEREDLPPAAIATLRQAENAGRVACYPPLACVEMLQDKVRQKQWYADNDLDTLPFRIVDGEPGQLEGAARDLGLPLVQKAPRGGFDGRGVQLLRSAEDLREKAWPGETLLERYAGEFREIAVLVVRSRDGDLRHFGPVDMTFEADYAVLDTVSAPARVGDATHARAVDLAYRAVTAMQGVGVFGVELFLLAGGEVLINEISPRVHNAGHYSLQACTNSQFTVHLQAVAGLEIGATDLVRPAAMKNLLCTAALKQEDRTREAGFETGEDGAFVYWYGKSAARLMRKLGHITATGASPGEALQVVSARWRAIQDQAARAAAP